MARVLLLILLQCGFVATAAAHGGGLDKCGGHSDRKDGAYHVHNHERHSACGSSAREGEATPRAATGKKDPVTRADSREASGTPVASKSPHRRTNRVYREE